MCASTFLFVAHASFYARSILKCVSGECVCVAFLCPVNSLCCLNSVTQMSLLFAFIPLLRWHRTCVQTLLLMVRFSGKVIDILINLGDSMDKLLFAIYMCMYMCIMYASCLICK